MKPAAFYDQVSTSYESPANEVFYRRTTRALLDLIPSDYPVTSILEIGAGTGFSTIELQSRFPKASITALEPSHSMLAKAKKRVDGITWVQQPLGDFSNDSHFDLVVCSVAAHWLSEFELSKLEDLGKNSMLALALPMPAKEGGDGNDILKKLIFSLKPTPQWPKETRHVEKLIARLQVELMQVDSRELRIQELYDNFKELADYLYARGALMALFGEYAELAAQKLFDFAEGSAAPAPDPVSFTWCFKLIIGRGHVNCGGENLQQCSQTALR